MESNEVDDMVAKLEVKFDRLKAEGKVKDYKIKDVSDRIEVTFRPVDAVKAKVVTLKFER